MWKLHILHQLVFCSLDIFSVLFELSLIFPCYCKYQKSLQVFLYHFFTNMCRCLLSRRQVFMPSRLHQFFSFSCDVALPGLCWSLCQARALPTWPPTLGLMSRPGLLQLTVQQITMSSFSTLYSLEQGGTLPLFYLGSVCSSWVYMPRSQNIDLPASQEQSDVSIQVRLGCMRLLILKTSIMVNIIKLSL